MYVPSVLSFPYVFGIAFNSQLTATSFEIDSLLLS